MSKLEIIVASTRPGRVGPSVAHWIESEAAAHGGFDDRAFYELFDRPRDTWPLPVRQERVDRATAPFEAWLAKAPKRLAAEHRDTLP